RRGDKIDFAWGSASGVLARRAVAAGAGKIQIRPLEVARPPRDSLLHRGRGLLEVEVVGLHLPASIRRGDLRGKENHNPAPGTASGRVIIADALTLLVDSRPHGTRQRGTLGLRYPFAAKKLGARERLRLELGCRCGRTRLRMRCFARKPEHEERAHERPCKWRMGPSALETTGTLTGNSGKRHRREPASRVLSASACAAYPFALSHAAERASNTPPRAASARPRPPPCAAR